MSITRGRPVGSLAVQTTPSWFVNRKVHELRLMQDFAVDADFLLVRIELTRAELGDQFSIDFDASVENQLLAVAAAGDAGGCEHVLQAVGRLRSCCVADRPRRAASRRRRGPAAGFPEDSRGRRRLEPWLLGF